MEISIKSKNQQKVYSALKVLAMRVEIWVVCIYFNCGEKKTILNPLLNCSRTCQSLKLIHENCRAFSLAVYEILLN